MPTDKHGGEKTIANAINEVRLGDALAEDDDLKETLAELAEIIEADSPKSATWSALELLRVAWSDYVSRMWKGTTQAFSGALKRFTHIEVERIRARGKAAKDRAEANKRNAEADAIRAAELRKDRLLDFLISQNIDMVAEQREDLLRIVFVKCDDPSTED